MTAPQLHGSEAGALDRQPTAAHRTVAEPAPSAISPRYRPADRLAGRVAIVTGSACGLSRSVAVGFGAEGAAVVIAHTSGPRHAMDTRDMLCDYGATCSVYPCEPADPGMCDDLVRHTLREFGRLDVLVNIPCRTHIAGELEDSTDEQLEHAFQTGLFPMLRRTRAALPHLKQSDVATIINTTIAPRAAGLGHDAANSAILSATRTLSAQLADHGVRVNAVVPAPDEQRSRTTRHRMPRSRALRASGPADHIGTYVFLASSDSSAMTGQVLRLDGVASASP